MRSRAARSGDAWLLADLARQAGGPLVILTAEPLEAQRLAEEIQLFAPNLSVRQLPDWETLPYDAFSPHQDLISERLHTLHALMTKSVDVLTVPVTTALYRLAPPPSWPPTPSRSSRRTGWTRPRCALS